MQNIGTFTVSSYLPPANPLFINTGGGWEYIRIINDSPYQLSVDVYGGIGALTIPEFFMQDILVPSQYGGSMKITPSINITSTSHAQSASLSINAYGKGEITSPTSQSIPQQSVTATASGKPIFTATVGYVSTATTNQVLNVFNPPNSGVNFTFHSAKVFTNDATQPAADLLMKNGGDYNFATSIPATSHNGTANPPVSFSHCTAQDGGATPGATVLDVLNVPANLAQEIIDFPDNFILAPGNNMALNITTAAIGKLVRLTFKWSEDIAVPPAGGVLTGMAITTLVNQGFPATTPIVTASPSGDGGVATLINNDGSATFGDTVHPGNVKVSGAANPAIDLSDANIVQAIKLIVGSITRISAVSINASTAGTFFNHGLGVIPDLVILVIRQLGTATTQIAYEHSTMTTTQVKVQTVGTVGTVGIEMISIKL